MVLAISLINPNVYYVIHIRILYYPAKKHASGEVSGIKKIIMVVLFHQAVLQIFL
jgi:hypothetical protein